MILCIDIGNTNIVFGLVKDREIVDEYRMQSSNNIESIDIEINIIKHYKEVGIDISLIKYSMIASVVLSINDKIAKFLENLKIDYIFVTYDIDLGLDILVDPPHSIGADLLVGSFMATKKYGYPNIVVDMGTATTFIVVNNKKEIIGGAIYPGVMTAFDALINKTYLLNKSDIYIPKKVISSSTSSCIQSGMIYGTVSLVEGLVNNMKQELGNDDTVKVIVTGGISKIYQEFFSNYIIDEELIIQGLYEIYNYINVK